MKTQKFKLFIVLFIMVIFAFSAVACKQADEINQLRSDDAKNTSNNEIENGDDEKEQSSSSKILTAGKYAGIIVGEDNEAIPVNTEVYYQDKQAFIKFTSFSGEDGQIVGCDNIPNVSVENIIPIKINKDVLEFTLNITLHPEFFEGIGEESSFSSSQSGQFLTLQWIFVGNADEKEMQGNVTFKNHAEKDTYGKWHMSMTHTWDELLSMYGAHSW